MLSSKQEPPIKGEDRVEVDFDEHELKQRLRAVQAERNDLSAVVG